MIVTVSCLSGLTKAYRSVLSALGSLLISGASRWLDARPAFGTAASVRASNPLAAMPARRRLRNTVYSFEDYDYSFRVIQGCRAWAIPPFCGRFPRRAKPSQCGGEP